MQNFGNFYIFFIFYKILTVGTYRLIEILALAIVYKHRFQTFNNKHCVLDNLILFLIVSFSRGNKKKIVRMISSDGEASLFLKNIHIPTRDFRS